MLTLLNSHDRVLQSNSIFLEDCADLSIKIHLSRYAQHFIIIHQISKNAFYTSKTHLCLIIVLYDIFIIVLNNVASQHKTIFRLQAEWIYLKNKIEILDGNKTIIHFLWLNVLSIMW